LRTRSLFASGSIIAVAFAALILVGVFTVALYKSHESALPPASASFRLWEGPPANATVHELEFRAVHSKSSFLEDHLDTALESGSSSESTRLRVEQMRSTLRELAGVDDATLFVGWQGHVVRVSFSGL
jgi:hypothetical protein